MSKFTSAFKAKVAIEAIKEKETIAELAKRFEVSTKKIVEWESEFLANSAQAFEKPADSKKELKKLTADNKRLLKKVGQMTIERDFFCESLRGCRIESEIAEIEKRRPAGLSRNRFCKLMKFNRSTLYYKPKGESDENLQIMEEMKRYHTNHPAAGVLTMVNMLALKGIVANPKRVRRLMRLMGIKAVYPQKSNVRLVCEEEGAAKITFELSVSGAQSSKNTFT